MTLFWVCFIYFCGMIWGGIVEFVTNPTATKLSTFKSACLWWYVAWQLMKR